LKGEEERTRRGEDIAGLNHSMGNLTRKLSVSKKPGRKFGRKKTKNGREDDSES